MLFGFVFWSHNYFSGLSCYLLSFLCEVTTSSETGWNSLNLSRMFGSVDLL